MRHPAIALMPILALALTACVDRHEPSGREDFQTFCAACHGASGRGDGPAADGLDRQPADLTGLSARNNGVFPGTRVMAKIWGYTGGKNGETPMPEFGPLLQGELVPYDGGDGIASPTPVRLVRIAEYLKTLQQ